MSEKNSCKINFSKNNKSSLPWKQEINNDYINKELDTNFTKYTSKYNLNMENKDWLNDFEIRGHNGIYINLEKNKENYTGYQGQDIWKAIYEENCFLDEREKMCLEKKIFFKIISGFHANVNLNICLNIDDFSLSKFKENLLQNFLDHKDRINNLFFLHFLFTSAFFEFKDKLEEKIYYDLFYTGNEKEDLIAKSFFEEIYFTKNKQNDLNNTTRNDIYYHFSKGLKNSQSVKNFIKYEKIDEIKIRFKKINEILNCVSCQKCRLHGKMQIYGISLMLKILFNHKISIDRNEFIAFINTFEKISRSIKFIADSLIEYKKTDMNFQKLYFSLIAILILFSFYSIKL